jgi:hypothetical protein
MRTKPLSWKITTIGTAMVNQGIIKVQQGTAMVKQL